MPFTQKTHAGGRAGKRRRGNLLKRMSLFAFVFAPLAPAGADVSAALGPEFAASFEKTDRSRSTQYAPGAGVSLYLIEDSARAGLFAHIAFLFPASLAKNAAGGRKTIDLSFYDIVMNVNVIAGPGLRFDLGALRLNAGAGINALAAFASSRAEHPLYADYYYSLFSLNLGAALALELSLETPAPFYIALGITASYDFANYTSVSSSGLNARGWAADYAMMSARPYLCFGRRFNDIEDGE